MDNEQLDESLEQTLDQIEQDDALEDSQDLETNEESSEVDEYEEKARTMGWVDKDEFKGDESRWTDAKTFVETAENRLPVMKENFTRLEQKYKELAEQNKAMREYQKDMGKRQYERALKELQEKQKEAVENADTEAFDKIEQEKQELQKQQNDYSPKETNIPQEPPEVQEWKARNPWYVNDPNLAQKAYFIEKQIMDEEALALIDDSMTTPMTLSERLEEVSKRVRERYGKKRPTPPKQADTKPQSRNKKAVKTMSDIPEADREKAKQWIKAGVVTEKEYLKDYFGE